MAHVLIPTGLPAPCAVARHYGDIFKQRAAPTRTVVDQTAAAMLRHAAAAKREQRASKRTESKKERRRKRLALREARLSGIIERYTDEVALLDDLVSAAAPSVEHPRVRRPSQEGSDEGSSPRSPKGALKKCPAVWPNALDLEILVPTATRMSGSLPRIDSASIPLDQLDQMAHEAPPSEAPPPLSPPEEGSAALEAETGARTRAQLDGAAEGDDDDDEATSPAAARKFFRVGDRVEVDFDDEGWFGGVIESVRAHDGEVSYCVKLDDGENADDVEGSEIRAVAPKGAKQLDAGSGGSEHSKSSGSAESRNTRSDALSGFEASGFEAPSVARSDDDELPQMQCLVTGTGVAWSFINEDELRWSPPTAALLALIDDRCRSPP
jgi:hypothetical protein